MGDVKMYELPARIRYSEVDLSKQLTVPSVVSYLQDCCSMQSEDIGYGIDWLYKEHYGWYVIHWEIHIKRLPKLGEHIFVYTAANGFKGIISTRSFRILDESGEEVVIATSTWVLMDFDEKKPIRYPQDMTEAYGIEPKLEDSWMGRKLVLQDNLQEQYRFVVAKVQTDTNRHMNNVWYVAAAMECVPESFSVENLRIEYKKQAMLGDELIVMSKKATLDKNLNVYYVSLQNILGECYTNIEIYGRD